MDVGLQALRSRRLPRGSTCNGGQDWFKEFNSRIQRGWAQMHIPLRRGEILMSSKFLNGPGRSTLHRQVCTERVPKDMHPSITQHTPSHPVPCLAKGLRQSRGHRHVSQASPLRDRDVALPL